MYLRGTHLKRLDSEILWTKLEHNGPYLFHNICTPSGKLEYALWLYSRVPKVSRVGKYFWTNVYDELKKRGYGGEFNRSELEALIRNVDYEYRFDDVDLETEADKYRFCIINDKLEAVQQWKMEPPLVYLSRAENHPQRGLIKNCILPEDVTINCGTKIPIPPPGHRWKEVVHNRGVRWLWSWFDNSTSKIKYVYPSADSDLHADSEIDKFNCARELGLKIETVRRNYMDLIKNPDSQELGCVLYIIDRFGIRVGNETNTGEVSGATTLRGKNLILDETNRVIRLRFLGKDSIPYDNDRRVPPDVFNAFRNLKRSSGVHSPLFPNVSSKTVNEYLAALHPGLTAKVFRTYNAGEILQRTLSKYTKAESQEGWLEIFKLANYEVSKFCNHRNKKSDYSLSTSIVNYIDPRIVVNWAESKNIPIERIYSKTLLKRFSWAINKNGGK